MAHIIRLYRIAALRSLPICNRLSVQRRRIRLPGIGSIFAPIHSREKLSSCVKICIEGLRYARLGTDIRTVKINLKKMFAKQLFTV